MIEKAPRLHLFNQIVNTLVRRNNTRSRSTKIYSMTTFTIALIFGIIQPTTSLGITSSYSGTLAVTSPAFVRPDGNEDSYYFYQALQFNASVAGQYIFTSNTDISAGIMGCLYQISFDPSNPADNLLAYNTDSDAWSQFLYTRTLQTEQTYILVMTAFTGSTGHYTAIVNGPGSVVMTPLLPIISIFNGTLSTNSTNFTRPDTYNSDNYYYQAMHITNYKRGLYTFRSESTLSSYGFLYNSSVNPNDPTANLIATDESSAGNDQFLIGYFLETNIKYTLVYTTQDENVTGDFKIISTGPSSVTLVPYTPTPPFNMMNVFGIAYSGFVALVVLLSILTCQRPKK